MLFWRITWRSPIWRDGRRRAEGTRSPSMERQASGAMRWLGHHGTASSPRSLPPLRLCMGRGVRLPEREKSRTFHGPSHSVENQSHLKRTHGSKIMPRSVYVVIEAYSKVGIKKIAAQNWVCLNVHQFNYLEHGSHSASGTNRQLPTYLAFKPWHSVTDKSSAVLSSHTHTRRKKKKEEEKKVLQLQAAFHFIKAATKWIVRIKCWQEADITST